MPDTLLMIATNALMGKYTANPANQEDTDRCQDSNWSLDADRGHKMPTDAKILCNGVQPICNIISQGSIFTASWPMLVFPT